MATRNINLTPSPEENMRALGYTPPAPNTSIRNLQLDNGNQGAFVNLNNQTANSVSNSTPSSNFGQLLMQLLQRHQTLGTGQFKQQEFNATDAQAQASTNAVLDPSLRNYAPGVIQGAASNAAAPYDPIISGAQKSAQTYKEQLASMGDALTTTRNFFNDLQTQENKKRDDARSLVKDSFTLIGGGAFDKANKEEIDKLEKEAGLPKGYIQGVGQTIKERELSLKTSLASVGNAANTDLAQQLVDGTLDPSQLSKRTTNYNAVLSEANKLSLAQTGKAFNIAQASIDFKFANQPNTQNTLNYLVSLTGGPGTTGNLNELINISNSINRTNFPALNKISNWTKLQTGNPQMAAYYAVATEVADQVAKILQGGGTGSGTSDAKLKQAADLFQSDFSKNQLIAVVNALKPLLNNRAKSMIGNNRYLQASYKDRLDLGGNTSDGTTRMIGPAGSFDVPNDKVDIFKQNGYK